MLADLLCEFLGEHSDWGARKLLRVPSPAGPSAPGVVPIATAAPNDVWTADVKGRFRTADGCYCSWLS